MNPDGPRRIGLIAGSGGIPPYFAEKARAGGLQLVSIGFTDEIARKLAPFSEKSLCIGLGRVAKILDTLKEESVRDLVILGKVDKRVIFRPQMFDLRSLKFLKEVKNKQDKTLLVGVIEELEKEGFRVLDQRELLGEIYPAKGVLSRRQPSPAEREDIEFGLPIAKKMADMEIGQTLIVKDKTVIAVEAVEGTDQAIRRGSELARGGCVVVKVSRTGQDYRYDSPGAGPDTLASLVAGGASVLALEAGRVMLVDEAEVVRRADEAGISVIAV